MLTSPPEIFARAQALKAEGREFVLASVIAVRGAASAKTGSKAIFDARGANILGWVGGGCAESFLAREALEVLKLKTPRIVAVDLDDEVFGLMPCGGVMDVYLEPHFPARKLQLPDLGKWNQSGVQFLQQLGFDSESLPNSAGVENWVDIFMLTAQLLAKSEDRPLRPWREVKGEGPAAHYGLANSSQQLTILGQSRITEELCRLSRLLEFSPVVFAQNPQPGAFPVGTSVCELPIDLNAIPIRPKSWVIVASHHQLDHKIIAHALNQGAEYVALVASEKRSKLISQDLRANGISPQVLARFFAPAGLVLPTETPTQIAFSILCEILFLRRGDARWI